MIKNTVLTLFVLVALLITYLGIDSTYEYSLKGKKIDHVQVRNQSFFTQFKLYMSNHLGAVLHVSGSEMAIDHSLNTIQFFSPSGRINRPSKGRFFDYEAKRGLYQYEDNSVLLKDGVHFFDNEFELKGNEVAYHFQKDEIKADGNVRASIRHLKTSDLLQMSAAKLTGSLQEQNYTFQGDVHGKIKRKRNYESNLTFKADKVGISEKQGEITLDQNVELDLRHFTATSHQGRIFLENYNKKLKYYQLNDDVRVTELIKVKGDKPIERKAFAESLEGKMKERKMILSGFPKVIQSGSVLTGNSIVLFENKKVIEVIDANSSFKVGNGN